MLRGGGTIFHPPSLCTLLKEPPAELFSPGMSHSFSRSSFCVYLPFLSPPRTCMGQGCLTAITNSPEIPVAQTNKDVSATTQYNLMVSGPPATCRSGDPGFSHRVALPSPRASKSSLGSFTSNKGQGERLRAWQGYAHSLPPWLPGIWADLPPLFGTSSLPEPQTCQMTTWQPVQG